MQTLLTYADVPKDYKLNLLWRAWLWNRMIKDIRVEQLVLESCKHDILFYINTFCWTFNPRTENSVLPFITYGFQDPVILKLIENVQESKKKENRNQRYDIGIEKSRDMGVTWIILYCIDWLYRFHENNRSFRVISRKEEAVDCADDEDALFQKMDFLEERLPHCMQIRGEIKNKDTGRTNLKLYNAKKQNIVKGESSSENAGRGGRNLLAFRDEEAAAANGVEITRSLNQTTRCQVRVSTPNGTGNSFHTAKLNGTTDWITLHWSEHPEKAAGLYSVEGGKIKVLDYDWHNKHPGYAFVVESTHADPGVSWEFLRSPWFDGECLAADSALDIAQELQISYLGSGSPFFAVDKLAAARVRHCFPPTEEGSLLDIMPERFMEGMKVQDSDIRNNRCKAWYSMAARRMPPQETTYTVGVDISAGSGASDSVISVGDDTTSRKVFEFYSNAVGPESFAKIAVAVARYFSTQQGVAFLAWDMGGHGLPFGNEVHRLGYSLVYYYKNPNEKRAKERKTPGVPSNRQIKNALMTDYRSALFNGMFVTSSRAAFEQAEQFVYDGSGGVCHQKSKSTENLSDVGEQHGDIVTSEAILWLAMRDRPVPVPIKPKAHKGSIAWMFEQDKINRQRSRSLFAPSGA